VGKSYRRQPVLRDVSLQAWPGQVLAITGENGSGKTTLLRICAGLEAPGAGTVRRGAAVGYCSQQPALFDLLESLDAAVSNPAALWPRLAVTTAYAAALPGVSWIARRTGAAARKEPLSR